MIEQVFIVTTKDGNKINYIGVQDIDIFKSGHAAMDTETTAAFEDYLLAKGFQLADNGHGITVYSRNGIPLPSFLWMLGDTS